MFSWIAKIFAGIGRFLFSFAKTSSGVLVEEIGDIAYDVVVRVERRGCKDKFACAKQELVKELGERATKYADHILNKAIEIAHGLLVDRGEEIKGAKPAE
jgi:hypothetical protein